jgi:AraC-like DNA-binding protein
VSLLTEPAGYTEWAPFPGLAGYVVCSWRDPSRPGRQPVLPDACIDLVWDGTTMFVAGPDTRAVLDDSAASFVGIRFRPGSAPRFLGTPASELVDTRHPLSEFWGSAALELADRMAEQPDLATSLLEESLLRRLPNVRASDRLVDGVVYELSRPERQLSVSRLANEHGVSERTLRRRCTDGLGYGPKTLDRILRFRRALRLLRRGHALADTARLAGYADQAHLANECRRLSNATPAMLAASQELTIAANGCD